MTKSQFVKEANNSLTRPSVTLVESYLTEWDTSEKYQLHEGALTLLFRQLCPSHDDVVQVLLKVSTLNDFYSTNIYNTPAMAKHIVNLNVEYRISDGDVSVVNDIASVVIGGKRRNCYSFASKYCNHHMPEQFPVFDSYVEKMLQHFRNVDRFAKFTNVDLRSYVKFVAIIKSFQQYYALERFSLRQIDVYLWLAGKATFGQSPQMSTKVGDLVQ